MLSFRMKHTPLQTDMPGGVVAGGEGNPGYPSRRIYFAVELYSFSFSRKYSSDFMVFPSDNLIIYGLPVI
jgi:hypothetical protein